MTSELPTTPSPIYFAPLQGAQFIVLTTFRASGAVVPTTVWFAEAGGNLYITTFRHSGKVKRIQANPSVLVASSDQIGQVYGPPLAARARLLDPPEHARATMLLRQKYGVQYETLTARMEQTAPANTRVFLEVTPP